MKPIEGSFFGTNIPKCQIIIGDCRESLANLQEKSVHCCVTSPPYFGLRDYGHAGQIGQEKTPAAFIAELVSVFRSVHRVLRDDGTLWVNIGDSYAGTGKSGGGKQGERWQDCGMDVTGPNGGKWNPPPDGFKQKDLMGIPWRLAFALQDDGWYLRSDIIWHKPNPMPESVTDRPTKAHEYLFLLTKSERYFYDADSIAEPANYPPGTRVSVEKGGFNSKWAGDGARKGDESFRAIRETRNKRTVWTVPTAPYSGAHFATFPPDLIRPCVRAGCPVGGTVLDPFGGSGTTGQVATEEGRNSILLEINPKYAELSLHRTSVTPGLGI